VGISKVKKKGQWVDHAFVWTPAGGMEDLTPTSSNESAAFDINDSGLIVGEMVVNGVYRGFRVQAGGQTVLLPGFPGADARGGAHGVNSAGQVVGWAWFGPQHAALWEPNGTIVDLGVNPAVQPDCFPSAPGTPTSFAEDINDHGTVVGYVGNTCGGVSLAFKWTQSTGMQALPMPFGRHSKAMAVNDDDLIAGYIQDVSGFRHAVLWISTDSVIVLGSFGGSSEATGINQDGIVVGTGKLPSGEERAFAWYADGGIMEDLTGGASRALGVSDEMSATGVNLVTGRAELWSSPPCDTILCSALESDSTRAAWVQQAMPLICSELRQGVQNAYANNEYGVNNSSSIVRGTHYGKYHTGETFFHYSLGRENPGLRGRWDFPPRDSITDFQQQLVQLAGSMTHEHLHHLYPLESDFRGETGGIKKRTLACVPSYMS
jgi:probable HAF family extracellular repeat protein